VSGCKRRERTPSSGMCQASRSTGRCAAFCVRDWSPRYVLVVEAVTRLKVRSCLIDGEAVACDANGLAVFEHLRRKTGRHVLLYAFDLVALDAEDLRREPFETARRRSPAFCAGACRASA
jgi:hypothetical protein